MKSIWTTNLKKSEFLGSQEFLENSREISLLDLDLEAFSFHFSFSISIFSHFHFTFHSRSRSKGFFISLLILEMSEPDFHFTLHFSKWVKQILISLFISRTSNTQLGHTLIWTMNNEEVLSNANLCGSLSERAWLLQLPEVADASEVTYTYIYTHTNTHI